VNDQRLADDLLHREARVERREWVLKDHLHLPADGLQSALAESGDVLPGEDDAPTGRLVEPHHGQRQR
jgi:hypothetical protein